MSPLGRHKPVLVVGLFLTLGSLLLSGGVAAAAPSVSPAPPTSVDSAGQPIGPLIDPFSQHTDANGVYANAPDPGKKQSSPPEDLKKYPKTQPTPVKSDTKNLSDADTDEVLSTEPGPEGFIRVTFYDPAPGVSPSQLVDMLHSKGTKSAQVVKNVKSTAGTGQPSASPMVAAGSPSDCVLGSALWTWCPIKAWANNGYARPIIRVNDHTGSGWTTDTQVAQINRAPKVDTHYLWNSCPLQAGARCFDAWSGNYGITGWVGITSIWVTNSYTLPEQAPDEQQQNGLYLNDWYNPAGSETGCGPDLSEGCTPFVKDHIILHELGHMWGLDHSGDPSDFMAAAQQAPGIPWNYIPSDSFSLLNQVYSVPH